MKDTCVQIKGDFKVAQDQYLMWSFLRSQYQTITARETHFTRTIK